jgi:hypothetical protein
VVINYSPSIGIIATVVHLSFPIPHQSALLVYMLAPLEKQSEA